MNGRRAIVGLCMVCALLVSAFAAQSASAIKGTTAVTCKKGAGDTGQPTFETAHCKPGEGSGEYGHYKIDPDTTTELTGNDNGGGTKLKATVGGVGITLTSTSLTGTGWMENHLSGNEHYSHGQGTIVYSGVTVNVPKCFVYTDNGTETPGTQGVVDTEELTATTQEQEMFLKFQPKEGTTFARFWITGAGGKPGECNIAGTYTVTGSVKGTPEGATVVATHAETTAQNTLKMGKTGEGAKAGLEGSLTIEGRDKKTGETTYTPLSTTTYPTGT